MVVEPIKTEDMETTTATTTLTTTSSSKTASGNLDMTLADIIKANKAKQKKTGTRGGKQGSRGGPTRGRGRGGNKQRGGRFHQGSVHRGHQQRLHRGGRGRGNRGGMRGQGREGIQLSTLRANMNRNQGAAIPPGPAKLLISNLDKGVSDSDIFELFAEFGTINEAAVHYDRLGRSVSTAHIRFARHIDAIKALKQYNGVNLDGRPMNMTIEADGRAMQRAGGQQRMNVNFNPGFGQMGGGAVKRLQQSQRGMGMRGRGRGGMRGGMRGGRGRGFAMNVNVGYGFNKNYSVGVQNRGGGRGRGRGNLRGRGGIRGRGAGAKRGGALNVRGRGGKRGAGNTRGGKRGGRGGKQQQAKPPTVEELDAELDSYLNETTA